MIIVSKESFLDWRGFTTAVQVRPSRDTGCVARDGERCVEFSLGLGTTVPHNSMLTQLIELLLYMIIDSLCLLELLLQCCPE